MLRRPFNYVNGVLKNGQLDQGLLFIAWQADLERSFIAVQQRLDREPLEEYVKPVGGGYFFALPGICRGRTTSAARLDRRNFPDKPDTPASRYPSAPVPDWAANSPGVSLDALSDPRRRRRAASRSRAAAARTCDARPRRADQRVQDLRLRADRHSW